MEAIEKIEKKLSSTRPKWHADVFSVKSELKIHNKITKEDILSDGLSLEEWFKNQAQIHKTDALQIHFYKSNGSGWVREKVSSHLDYKNDNGAMVHQAQVIGNPSAGLNGLGLNAVQILDMNTKAQNYDRAIQDLDRERQKVEDLTSKLEEKKEAYNALVLSNATNRPGILENPATAELLKILAPAIQNVATAAATSGASAAPAGLSGIDNIPQYKKSFIDFIVNEKIDVQTLANIYFTIEALLSNPNFKKEFEEILTVYNLLQQVPLKKAN